MFRWKNKVAAATAMAVLSLVATACGDSDESASGKPKLVIATSGTFRPITFSDGGKLTGYDIEAGTEIAKRAGYDVEFVSGQLSGLLPGLNAGKFDAVMSGLTMTDQRKQSITFSEPYLADGTVAVVKADNTKVKDITQLSGLNVGVIGGSATQTVVQKVGGYAELKEYPGAPEGFADVAAGRVEVFAAGRIAAEDFVKNSPKGSEVKIVGNVHAMMPAGVGLPKEDKAGLKAKFDAAIAAMWSDGTLKRLQEKWFGHPIDLPKA
ncbi:transporter substrate-binding domain-containing protein [Nocardia camponoti]|uniref:ABC transporter substrate-binding protein n=1 Tax=Nocardia camponoti TaxID=1616106 RepID=A0A917QBU6_9NOCA|nr:transporter substrate-binding domain-containing protein [Nocardia camponoti]GGK42042.1 ABC transporter substrate-binding protein [Nocardia camponoti]